MSNYREYLKQIEDLKAKAENARKEETAAVIADIKQKIRFYGLSAVDLGLAERKPRERPAKNPAERPAAKKTPRKAKAASPQKGVKRRIKYRGPEGQPWSGVGRKPRWVVAATAAGRSLEEFEVKP